MPVRVELHDLLERCDRRIGLVQLHRVIPEVVPGDWVAGFGLRPSGRILGEAIPVFCVYIGIGAFHGVARLRRHWL